MSHLLDPGLNLTLRPMAYPRFFEMYRAAIKNDPRYRADPDVIKTALRGFITTPDYNRDLASFLHDDIGAAAQSYLAETASGHPNAAIRARAAAGRSCPPGSGVPT